MTFPNVILIGGAPLVGKTTVARLIAARLGYSFLSIDDFDATADAAAMPVHQQIAAAERRHHEIWPRITAAIEERAARGEKLVIEGRALCPERVRACNHSGMAALWLNADEGVLAERCRSQKAMSGDHASGMSNTRLLARACWCSRCIRQAARHHRLTVVEIPRQADPALVCDICLAMLPDNITQ